MLARHELSRRRWTQPRVNTPIPLSDYFDIEKHFDTFSYCPLVPNIAAVTCYFNPHKSEARKRCYTTFARQFPRIGLNLWTAEGSLDNHWEIPDDQNVFRFNMDPKACLFAKENLLNLAIERLPDYVDYVLWIDADFLVMSPDFTDKLQDELDRHEVVQAFSTLRYFDQYGNLETKQGDSLAALNRQQGKRDTSLRPARPGGVWAARRELLVSVGGLYDRCITGSGDVAWAEAVFATKNKSRNMKYWSDKLIEDVLVYCRRVANKVHSVGVVDVSMSHLYHGELKNREYVTRHQILIETDYCPQQHIEYASNNTLCWSPEAPELLQKSVRDYLKRVNEE